MPKRPYEIALSEALYLVTRPDYKPVTDVNEFAEFMKELKVAGVTAYDLFTVAPAEHRLGQKFMNSLPDDEYHALTGTPIDPFHKNNPRSIFIAVDYLLYIKE